MPEGYLTFCEGVISSTGTPVIRKIRLTQIRNTDKITVRTSEKFSFQILHMVGVIFKQYGTIFRFTGVITHAGCWENTRKVCKARAESE